MKKVFAELARLARTPQFAIVGVMGVYGSVNFLMHYPHQTDKSGGLAYIMGVGTVILSASYVGLFLFLRVKDKKASASATKKDQE